MLKNKIIFFLSFIILSWVSVAQAYIGLCCAHCGGNMPLNIFGGGIPEPKEFRFKFSQMIMEMGPLRDGTDEISNDDLIGSANGTNFPALPTNMQMYMTMIGAAYSFSDDFAVMGMTSYIENTMRMNLNNGNDFTMTSGVLEMLPYLLNIVPMLMITWFRQTRYQFCLVCPCLRDRSTRSLVITRMIRSMDLFSHLRCNWGAALLTPSLV
jgi:hypothetical protein